MGIFIFTDPINAPTPAPKTAKGTPIIVAFSPAVKRKQIKPPELQGGSSPSIK